MRIGAAARAPSPGPRPPCRSRGRAGRGRLTPPRARTTLRSPGRWRSPPTPAPECLGPRSGSRSCDSWLLLGVGGDDESVGAPVVVMVVGDDAHDGRAQ